MTAQFQTNPIIAAKMVELCVFGDCTGTILEPTPGDGNIVRKIKEMRPGLKITAPKDFWKLPQPSWYDFIIMNPPFSPMPEGYRYLDACMEMSNRIVALMPWLTLINSTSRLKKIMDFGLISITHLPRKAFPGSRVQTCILNMAKPCLNDTRFYYFDY